MSRMFIGGSRRISRLNRDVRELIDDIVDQRFAILIGDANGVDKAVQRYLSSKQYDLVEVFCAGDVCRNNVGHWPTRTIDPQTLRRGFSFYAAKDRVMADEATAGLMVWDGESVGTLMNVFRLVHRNKQVTVFIAPTRRMLGLKKHEDWTRLVETCDADVRNRIERETPAEALHATTTDTHLQLPLL